MTLHDTVSKQHADSIQHLTCLKSEFGYCVFVTHSKRNICDGIMLSSSGRQREIQNADEQRNNSWFIHLSQNLSYVSIDSHTHPLTRSAPRIMAGRASLNSAVTEVLGSKASAQSSK